MALLKVTAANALPTVRQLIADLRKTLADAGPTPTTDAVSRGLDALDAFCTGRVLDVEVAHAGALGADLARRVAAWLGSGVKAQDVAADSREALGVERPGPLSLRVRCGPVGRTRAVVAGSPRPAVLVVATLTGELDEAARDALDEAAQDRGVAFVVGPPLPPVDEIHARVAARACACERVTIDALSDDGLGTRLTTPPWDGRLELLRAHSAAFGVESLAGALSLGLDAQLREGRVRRQVAQQRLARFQTKGPAAAPSAPAEFLGQVKARVQRLFSEFERGAADRLQELVGQPAGSLTQEIEARLNGLSTLEHEARTTTLATRVPPAVEHAFTVLIRERVGRYLMADVVALNDLFRLLGQEIERMLAEADGPPLVLRCEFLTEERVRKVLASYSLFQSSYRGEMPRPGFGEYFASVRKYAMILVMGASMFGLSSVVRQYREYTIPITVMLVLFGTASVMISTQTERVENLEKELEAARNSMRPELRRILSEIQKQWTLTLSQHLGEQATAILEQVDGAFKAHQSRKDAAALPERDRLQRQIQALDALEKKLPALAKAREAVLASAVQVKGDLRPVLSGAPPAGASRLGIGAARAAAPAAAVAKAAPAAAAAEAEEGPSPARERLAALQAKVAAARAAAKEAAAGQDDAAASPARQKLEALKAKMAAARATPAASAQPSDGAAPAGAGDKPDAAVSPARQKLLALKAKMAAARAKPAGSGEKPPEGTPPAGTEPS